MKIKELLAFALAGAMVSAGMPAALAATSRMDKIKSTGEIAIGYRDAAIPFSYLDDNQRPIGYSMDICHGVVKALERDLKIPKIKVKLVPVVGSTRIPLVDNGTVDLVCGSPTNNAERQRLVSFTPTIYVAATRFTALKKSNLRQLSDFKGKTVVSVAGSTNIKWLSETNAKDHLGMHIIAAKDHPEAFLTVASGRAAAFFMDDILLAGLVANAHDPSAWMISKTAYTIEPYGIIEPKGDPQFKTAVDDAVKAMMKDGKVTALYTRWFTQPIAPKNVNLNWPMTPELRKAIAHPTDSPNPEMYK